MGSGREEKNELLRLQSILRQIPKGESSVTRILTPFDLAQFIVSSKDQGYDWQFSKRIPIDLSKIREEIYDSCLRAGVPTESLKGSGLQDAIEHSVSLTEPFDGIIRGRDLHDGKMMVEYALDTKDPKKIATQKFLVAAATHPEVKDPRLDGFPYERHYFCVRARGLPEREFDIEPESYKVAVANVAKRICDNYDRSLIELYTKEAIHPVLVDLREEARVRQMVKLTLLLDNLELVIKKQKELARLLRQSKAKRTRLVA